MKLIEKWENRYSVINVGSGQLLLVNDIANEKKDVVNSSFKWLCKKANTLDTWEYKLNNLQCLKSMLGEFEFTLFYIGSMKTKAWYDQRIKSLYLWRGSFVVLYIYSYGIATERRTA